MTEYSKVIVTEAHLEDLIRQDPSKLEQGLRFVDQQLKTRYGRLDLLMVDSGGSLVVAELKVIRDDNMLGQGLDYYDFLSPLVDTYSRVYPNAGIDPSQPVRLMRIAPEISELLLHRCRWVDLPISLFEYQAISVEGVEHPLAIFTQRQIPSRPKAVELPTVDGHLNYITDSAVRSSAERLVDNVRNLDPQLITTTATATYISMKRNGRVFAYLTASRKKYTVSAYDADGTWKDASSSSSDDAEMMLQLITASIQTLLPP